MLGAEGAGVASIAADGGVLDVWFPRPSVCSVQGVAGVSRLTDNEAGHLLPPDALGMLGHDALRDVERIAVAVTVPDIQTPVRALYDGYLRLHLLSWRLAQPRQIQLDGLLELMSPAVAWTTLGPCRTDRLERLRIGTRAAGMPFAVRGIFPIPPMLDYVAPSGVMIADGQRVLLGAHLAPGTIVTPEGFCSANAGTLGPCMVEGRISAGVVVGGGGHIGGGASLMGVVSGGGRMVVSVGERCLLGANSGIGIPLGDDCIVEAGCYVTAGALITTPEGVVKAAALAGRPRLIFRRNSVSGALEAIENNGRWQGLNPVLHPDSAAATPAADFPAG